MSSCPVNPADDGAGKAFDGRMSYDDDLRTDQIPGAQATLISAHDEMLLIIRHKTSELWMRLARLELAAVRSVTQAGQAPKPARCWRAPPPSLNR